MSLMVLGVDHRSTPTSVREILAFPGECHSRGLAALKASFPDTEFVLLSTCNRVEVYAAAEPAPPEVDELASCLARFHRIPVGRVAGHLVVRRDEAAIGHLFRVAAGLESLVPGEDQILGQVRDAYKAATGRGVTGPILHAAFQRALRAAKRARDETGMGRGKLSVASIAVDVARDVFDHFDDKTILVIGAGKMGEQALQHLRALRPGVILVANRDVVRAGTVADGGIGRIIAFDGLDDALIEADIVISATAAAEPIMTLDRFTVIQRARRHRPLLVVDIAVPRNFDPRIGELEQVMLYDVGDLRAQVERNLADRRQQLKQAQAIVEREAAACFAALRHPGYRGPAPPARRPHRGRSPPRARPPLRRPARIDRRAANGDRPRHVAVPQSAPPPPAEYPLRGRGHRRHRRCQSLARRRPPPLRPGRRAPLRPRRAAHSREPPDKGLDKLGHVTTGSTSMNLEGPMRCFRTLSHRHRLVAAVSS